MTRPAILQPYAHSESRAQMLLVGALALATLVVGLALVLNSAIYTENLATRSEQTDVARSIGFQDAVSQAGDPAIRYTNWNYHEDYGTLNRNLTNQTREWVAQAGAANSRKGQLVGLEADLKNGTRLVQDDGGDFQPYDTTIDDGGGVIGSVDDPNWVAADDIRARNFTMEVTRSSVGRSMNESVAAAYLDDLDGDGKPFSVAFKGEFDSDPDYKFAIYQNIDNSSEVNLTVYDETDDTVYTCDPIAADEISLDMFGGTFGGETCEGLSFVHELPDSYEIQYINPEQAGGNYSLVVNRDMTDFQNEMEAYTSILGDAYADHDHTDSDNPYLEPAIYSVDYTLTYRTTSVIYEKTVRVAPGEL